MGYMGIFSNIPKAMLYLLKGDYMEHGPLEKSLLREQGAATKSWEWAFRVVRTQPANRGRAVGGLPTPKP